MRMRLAALAVSILALGAVAPAMAQQGPPGGMPAKSDPHVAELYALVKQAIQTGLANVDHKAMMAQLKTIADAHAAETGADPAQMEQHVMMVAHQAAMAAEADPHMLDTLDTFWAGLHQMGAPSMHGGHPHGAE